MGRRNSGAILPFFNGFPIFRPILNLSFPWKRSGPGPGPHESPFPDLSGLVIGDHGSPADPFSFAS